MALFERYFQHQVRKKSFHINANLPIYLFIMFYWRSTIYFSTTAHKNRKELFFIFLSLSATFQETTYLTIRFAQMKKFLLKILPVPSTYN
jgi:hypothetical protein